MTAEHLARREQATERALIRQDNWVLTEGRHLEGPMSWPAAQARLCGYEGSNIKILVALEDHEE